MDRAGIRCILARMGPGTTGKRDMGGRRSIRRMPDIHLHRLLRGTRQQQVQHLRRDTPRSSHHYHSNPPAVGDDIPHHHY